MFHLNLPEKLAEDDLWSTISLLHPYSGGKSMLWFDAVIRRMPVLPSNMVVIDGRLASFDDNVFLLDYEKVTLQMASPMLARIKDVVDYRPRKTCDQVIIDEYELEPPDFYGQRRADLLATSRRISSYKPDDTVPDPQTSWLHDL